MPVGDFVYRAVKQESWLRRGQPKQPAFRRRWREDKNGQPREFWDENGLSFGLTPEDACRGLTENHGVMRLSVALLRARNFEFDEPADGHVNIINMPFYRDDLPDELGNVNRMISWVLECVEEVIPPNATLGEPTP